jgi:hypothetical protein
MSRSVPRRVMLAATVSAAAAAFALPAAAHAARVEEAPAGTLRFVGEGGEQNILSVTRPSNGPIELQNLGGITTRTPLCAQVSSVRVRCALGIQLREVLLGAGNDLASINVSDQMTVNGGTGNDSVGPGPTLGGTRVTYIGGDGFDTVTYDNSAGAVKVTPATFDGRPGLDQDILASDLEKVVGSDFNDELTGFGTRMTLSGGRGDDLLTGSANPSSITTFDMGRRADGADRHLPKGGINIIDYSQRTLPVTATLNNGKLDDGEAGEGDSIAAAGSMIVDGGSAGDTIIAATAAPSNNSLHGNGGDDRVEGGEGSEFVAGGPGVDLIIGNGGNDQVDAKDGVGDVVGCGTGTDTAFLDSLDIFSSCETRPVGALRLAPKTVRAEAAEVARVKLSWRHPKTWKQLKRIELRLTHAGAPVGAIAIAPRTRTISAVGAVKVARRASRVRRDGKTVTARLAIRLDRSLAGQTLSIEVKATDTRGRRQLERNAGTVRVSG